MDKDLMFIFFQILNCIFGFTGICLIASSIVMIIKIKFSPISVILIIIGVLMILLTILGLKSKKKFEFMVIYLSFIIFIIIFYGFLSVMFIAFSEKLNDFIQSKLNIHESYNFENHKLNLCIISGGEAFLCIILFIVGVLYCKKIKVIRDKKRKDKNEGDDILRGLDYSMPLDSSAREN